MTISGKCLNRDLQVYGTRCVPTTLKKLARMPCNAFLGHPLRPTPCPNTPKNHAMAFVMSRNNSVYIHFEKIRMIFTSRYRCSTSSDPNVSPQNRHLSAFALINSLQATHLNISPESIASRSCFSCVFGRHKMIIKPIKGKKNPKINHSPAFLPFGLATTAAIIPQIKLTNIKISIAVFPLFELKREYHVMSCLLCIVNTA